MHEKKSKIPVFFVLKLLKIKSKSGKNSHTTGQPGLKLLLLIFRTLVLLKFGARFSDLPGNLSL